MTLPAFLEQTKNGSWCAYTVAPAVMTGLGDSRESAIADLQVAAKFWIEHMKETGQPIPVTEIEVTSIEVAA